MRINIVIDNKLITRALRLFGIKNPHRAMKAGPASPVKLARQVQLRRARGKLRWEGDLDMMRRASA